MEIIVKQYPSQYEDLNELMQLSRELLTSDSVLVGTDLTKDQFMHQAVFVMMSRYWALEEEHKKLKRRFIDQSKELSVLKRKNKA